MNMTCTPSVRVQLLHPYLDYVRTMGIEPAPLLARLGWQRARLADPLDRIPLRPFLGFTHDVAAATRDPYVGLHIGSLKRPEDSALGLLFLCVDTLREALESMVESAGALVEGAQVSLMPVRENWGWSYRLEGVDAQLARHDIESTFASLIRRIQAKMGKEWRPVELHFEHSPVARSRAVYEQIFQAPVLFDQPLNQIVVSSTDLSRRTRFDRSAMVEVLQQHLANLRDDMAEPRTMANRVALAVARQLGHMDCSLVSVARELNISPRSMQRRLSVEGVSFQEIVRRERRRVAESLIRQDGHPSMAEIATRLGYADETTLSRAFKSWVGAPPGRYARGIRRTRAAGAKDIASRSIEGSLHAGTSRPRGWPDNRSR
jgi:AraC-like DNA-binding protein